MLNVREKLKPKKGIVQWNNFPLSARNNYNLQESVCVVICFQLNFPF